VIEQEAEVALEWLAKILTKILCGIEVTGPDRNHLAF